LTSRCSLTLSSGCRLHDALKRGHIAQMNISHVCALVSAVVYSLGSLLIKRALTEGVSPWRVPVTLSWVAGILFIPLFFTGEPLPELRMLWLPVLSAFCWFAGNYLQSKALIGGDVSLVGPFTGMKPVLTALILTLIFGVSVPVVTWIAGGLVLIALLIMRTPNSDQRTSFSTTLFTTLAAMILFSLNDTLFQYGGKVFGVFRLIAAVHLLAAILCLSLRHRFEKSFRDIPVKGRTFLLAGIALFIIPTLLLPYAFGRYGNAAELNVLYSSRALWSIMLVWVLGRYIGNREHLHSRTVLLLRLAGSLILMAAIALIIL
jgi:drug/metabolite transporter (DMT)-like permease